MGQRKAFYGQRIPESSCTKEETFNIDKNHAIYQNNEWTSLENKEVEPVEPVQMSVYQSNIYRKYVQIYRDIVNSREQKLHQTNQGSYFLGGSFNNRDNVRAPMQF